MRRTDRERECVDRGECRPRHMSRRKDRARWCGGHEGREHEWRWVNSRDLKNADAITKRINAGVVQSQTQECARCGKQKGHRNVHTPCGQPVSREGYRPHGTWTDWRGIVRASYRTFYRCDHCNVEVYR